MHKSLVVLLRTLTLVFVSRVSCAQSKVNDEPFPTYKQIRPATAEIVDYVSPGGVMTIRSNAKINLFNYPKNTVTYLLNGKATTNADSVKAALSGKGAHIEAVSIGKPDESGKRIITITYEIR